MTACTHTVPVHARTLRPPSTNNQQVGYLANKEGVENAGSGIKIKNIFV